MPSRTKKLARTAPSGEVRDHRSRLREIEIGGVFYLAELRVCANKGCESSFWALKGSPQSICSHKCWEFVNHRPFWRQPLPPVRLPGERRKPGRKPKRKRHATDGLGQLNFAKHPSKRTASLLRESKAASKPRALRSASQA